MSRDALKLRPWSYKLYLESCKPDVDWKIWVKKVKEFQENFSLDKRD